MLSERERQALDEIERTISRSDPRLAQMLGRARTDRVARRYRWAHDVVAVVAMLSGVLCLCLGQIGAGLTAVAFAAIVVLVRRARFAPPERPASGPRRPRPI